jgi:hypothetical protein
MYVVFAREKQDMKPAASCSLLAVKTPRKISATSAVQCEVSVTPEG